MVTETVIELQVVQNKQRRYPTEVFFRSRVIIFLDLMPRIATEKKTCLKHDLGKTLSTTLGIFNTVPCANKAINGQFHGSIGVIGYDMQCLSGRSKSMRLYAMVATVYGPLVNKHRIVKF